MVKDQKPEQEAPKERTVATLHMPMDMGDLVSIMQAIAGPFPNAELRNQDGDTSVVAIIVTDRVEVEEPQEAPSRASELLGAIVGEEKLSGMIDVAEENGMLTSDEAADLRHVCVDAETFLGFGGDGS